MYIPNLFINAHLPDTPHRQTAESFSGKGTTTWVGHAGRESVRRREDLHPGSACVVPHHRDPAQGSSWPGMDNHPDFRIDLQAFAYIAYV